MDGFEEIHWKEFYAHPGVFEIMSQLYKETGIAIKLRYDPRTGGTKAVPIIKNNNA